MNPILARTRQVLTETGKNQRALAADGIASQQTLSRIATVDEAEPSAATLATICAKLGINGHWLLTGQGEKRVLAGGGDVVFAAGVVAGRIQAVQAIEALPPISGGTDGEPAAFEKLAVRKELQEEAKGAPHRRPGAAAGRRRAGRG